MTDNRRQFTRIVFSGSASLSVGPASYPVEVIDLSLKGALVRPLATMPLQTGAAGVLLIHLDDAAAIIHMGVTVARQTTDTCGLACHEIDIDSITHLRRLVELNLGDESVLEREIAHLTGA